MRLRDVILRGARASQPAATTVVIGTLYYVTDENVTERSNGTAWEDFSDAGGGGVADADYGDITVSGVGTVWTIDNGVVTSAKLATGPKTKSIVLTIDGAGSVITTGVKGYLRIPVAGTITAWTLLADQAGSIVIDVWKDTFANFPPTDADSITNGSEPELSAAASAEDTNLGDWTTVTVTAGDVLGFNVDSVATVTRVTLQLTFTVTG